MRTDYNLLAVARIHLAIAFACFVTGVTLVSNPEHITWIPVAAWAFGTLLFGVFMAQMGIAEYRGYKAGIKNGK